MEAKAEKHGNKYPRPVMECKDCGMDVILCWGPKRNHYFRHKGKKTCTSNGESMYHLMAKSLLVDYLQKGGTVVGKNKCLKHKRTYIEGVDAKSEVRIGNEILDVAVSNNGVITSCIEVKYSHATVNMVERGKLKWIEVDAKSVIKILDTNILQKEIVLEDLKKCCVRTYSKELTSLNMEEIAQKLGYMVLEDDECTWDRESDCKDRAVWNYFISLKKCLMCTRNHKTSWYRPYCKKCYSFIIYEEERRIDREETAHFGRSTGVFVEKEYYKDLNNHLGFGTPDFGNESS